MCGALSVSASCRAASTAGGYPAPSSAKVKTSLPACTSACTVIFTGGGLCRTLLLNKFSTSRPSSARSADRVACSAAGVWVSVTSQLAAVGLSQNSATSARSSGPTASVSRRSGCAPYCSLLVRFKSSISARSRSLWVRMPPAFARAAAGRAASCSSCSAQPKISASGVRTSWLTPATHWVRALSRRAMISLRFCSCALVRFNLSASSPVKPSVGSVTGWPSASASSPAATRCSRRAPSQLNTKQTPSPAASSANSCGSAAHRRLRSVSGDA